MRRKLFIGSMFLLLFITAGCAKKTAQGGGEIVFAQIKNTNTFKEDTLLWLKIKGKHTFGVPLDKVQLFSTKYNTFTPWATVYYNRAANVYQVDIEMPTLADIQYWQEAFDKNERVILYPKP